MYNVELVRQLCRDIDAAKSNRQKEEELLSLLQAIVKEDHEEVRVRMAFLLKKYGSVVSEAKGAAAD